MDWLWNLQDPAEWSALAALATFVIALAAAIFAVVQILDARSLRREQTAPYVIAKLDENDASPSFIDFVVVNIGSTPAFDIRLEITPPMVRADEIPSFPFMGARPITNGIKMLAPGQEIRMHFDTAIERDGKDLPSLHTVTVAGKDSRGKELKSAVFELDADWKRNTVHAEVRNLHWIGARIEGIEKSVKNIASSVSQANAQPKVYRDPASALKILRRTSTPPETVVDDKPIVLSSKSKPTRKRAAKPKSDDNDN